jgi:large subunit ribosomal protein L35
MPKNKTHSGMKKRVRVTARGKLLSQRAGVRHNFEHKSSKLTRRLSGTTIVSDHDAPRIKKMLGR